MADSGRQSLWKCSTMNISFMFQGIEALQSELIRKSSIQFISVGEKSIRDIYARSQKPGGTPVDLNELRMSAKYRGDEFSYSAPHGPHVEYGHRLRNGRFIPGQHFLKRNVDTQRPIYRQDLIHKIKE